MISTTTKHDVFELTSGARARRGPVHVFNPQDVGNVPPHSGGTRSTAARTPQSRSAARAHSPRLIGDPARGLLAGERPAPTWVAAAAAPQRPVDDAIQRRFRLFDGTGTYIYPEGRPGSRSSKLSG